MLKREQREIADTLKAIREGYGGNDTHWDRNLIRACDEHAKQLASMIASTDPKFNRCIFLRSCGVSEC